MRRTAFLVAAALAATAPLGAQSRDGAGVAAVKATVEGLFDAMRAADSTAARSLFHADARLISVESATAGEVVRVGSIDRFIAAIGGEHELWDERIWNTEVRIDGALATVWTDYAFYVGDRLSHCGVDAFQLVRSPEGWKILQIADTRRTESCEVPPDR